MSKAPTQIRDLSELSYAVAMKQSVHCPSTHCWNRPRPAAFVINLSGAILVRLFRAGMFIYTPKKSSK
jgi:hypothetical protein